jgi:inner membrane protein
MKIEISDNMKWHSSLTIKMILLAFLSLFLLAPLEMIKSIIQERQANSDNVKKEISSQWAGSQVISGPVLNIPVRITPEKKDAESYLEVLHIMPDKLNIAGKVLTEKRHRSIYQAVVFNADLVVSGLFSIPETANANNREILWSEAYYSMGISDNRGIKGSVFLNDGITDNEAMPGLKDNELFATGITFPAQVSKEKSSVPFNIKLNISGTEGLKFTPVGKTTEVALESPWISPGFNGKFLPADRNITDNGFNASWIITNLNRNFPQSWTGKSFNAEADSFGVDFVLQVDHYQKSLRSAKYGILFIALTFLALIFAELAIGENIHLFHYILVAMALVLFFSLLNALSEHLGFNIAYLISSASTIILITLFLKALIRKSRTVFLICGLLVFLYSFIFILLTLNDYAYLAGNIGLFILLAATMVLSVRLKIFGKENESA